MSWKSVKNFLIILLVLVNILLAFFVYKYYTNSRFTDSGTVESAAALLKESGIEVSNELINVKKENAKTLYVPYEREEYVCLVASVLLGKEADGMYMLPHGVRAEAGEGEIALIGYDMSIEYTASGENDILSLIEKASKADDGDAKTAISFLEEKIALAAGTADENDCSIYGDYVFVNVKQKENGIPLYGMDSVFGIKDGKIVYASGKYFFGVPESEEESQLLDRINILFSEKEQGMTGTVEEMELCYTLYEGDGKMMLIPSYALRYADGNMRAINAISKKLY